MLDERPLVDQLLDALAGRHAGVVLALVADLQVVFELADIQQLAAALVLAPHPQALAARGRVGRRRARPAGDQ